MQSNPTLDSGKPFDWGKTSADYLEHRPGYPDSFFDILGAIGIGHSGHCVLDIATGPGVLALPLARAGAKVTGIDIAANQVEAARELADREKLDVTWMVADAQETGLPDDSFDIITASMCMHYFDPDRILPEIRRMLAPGGRFLVASLLYSPRESSIAAATERLILEHNPKWGSADFDGAVPPVPRWSLDRFSLVTFHRYVEDIPFTRASWRGRIRACRGVAASLGPREVEAFDRAHAELLERIADEQFTIPHVITVHVFE